MVHGWYKSAPPKNYRPDLYHLSNGQSITDFDPPEIILGNVWLVGSLQYLRVQKLPTSCLRPKVFSGNLSGNSLPALRPENNYLGNSAGADCNHEEI